MLITKWWIDDFIWFFCLDHPGTNITRVSNFIVWIFVTSNYIFTKVFIDIHHTSYFEYGHLLTGIINFDLLVPRQYRQYFAKFYTYPDSDPTAMLGAPWATSLRCHGSLGHGWWTLFRRNGVRNDICDWFASIFATGSQRWKGWDQSSTDKNGEFDLSLAYVRYHFSLKYHRAL